MPTSGVSESHQYLEMVQRNPLNSFQGRPGWLEIAKPSKFGRALSRTEVPVWLEVGPGSPACLLRPGVRTELCILHFQRFDPSKQRRDALTHFTLREPGRDVL